ncbi:MAG: HTTM domain-containing protein [Reichenbachiella sp.]
MTEIKNYFENLNRNTSALPLAIFRMAFGFLMAFSQVRFLWKGWVDELYLSPQFHFTFPGFHWVEVLTSPWMYGLVVFSIILAIMIAFGLFYRIASVLFFLAFTYLELIDMSLYLNHYYFISLISFLLIFMPAHHYLSLDVRFKNVVQNSSTLQVNIELIKWQLAIVYLFAGIAKIKTDWLFNAQPMNIWLSARTDFPLIGSMFGEEWVALAFSWSGMIYDCTIPFFLWNKKTRSYAFAAVVIFHVITWLLFNIGMFPWIMIAASLIFFEKNDWIKLFSFLKIKNWLSEKSEQIISNNPSISRIRKWSLLTYFFIQLALPLRQHFYSGNPLWTELGYRFSWNVMLAEKTGYCHFVIKDKASGKSWNIQPSTYLTNVQEKQMSFQPDMIWQFAHFLKKELKADGLADISISVYNKVSLNGRKSQFLINPKADLLDIQSVFELNNIILDEFPTDS